MRDASCTVKCANPWHSHHKPVQLVFKASSYSPHLAVIVCRCLLQVTDAIKQYVEEKITKAVHNYAHNIKKIDVTISARGGDTGTHGAK